MGHSEIPQPPGQRRHNGNSGIGPGCTCVKIVPLGQVQVTGYAASILHNRIPASRRNATEDDHHNQRQCHDH